MQRNRGFTLIEMMIVVAVIAIITTLAYPSYDRFVQRTRRADGKEMLMRVAASEESHMTNFNKYTKLADLGYVDPTSPSQKGYYAVSVVLANGDSKYTLSATPVGVQVNDACGALKLDSTGKKDPDASDVAHNTNGPCW